MARRAARRIAIGYVLVALGWLCLSDPLVLLLGNDVANATWMQMSKGAAFMLVTGGLLYVLCHRQFRALLRSRERLRESRRRYINLVGNLPGMVYRCLCDDQWTMLYASNGVHGIAGLPVHDMLGNRQTYNELIHPDDRDHVRDTVYAAVDRHSRFELEYRLVLADGGDRWVWEQGVPTFDEFGEVEAIEGFVTDITLRKKAEQLERERNMFVKEFERTDEAINIIGHELRTPLASLRAMSELLLSDTTIQSSRHGGFVQGIHSEVVRMSEMVTNMLEAARLGADDTQWKWQQVDVQRVCREAVDIVRPLRRSDDILLEVDCEPRNMTMRGDPDAVRRLVLNLLGNACRFTKQGAIRVIARQANGDGPPRVTLHVEDTGPGLDPQQQQKLGVPFALNHGTMHPAMAHGTGLGLAICNQIAAVHGGHLSVTSKRDVGTTFIVDLRADLDVPQADAGVEPIRCDVAA